jgi:branched-chain amino acid transport system permease protein
MRAPIHRSACARLGLTAVAGVLLLAAPLLLDSFRLFQVTIAMIYAIALFGLNILTGYNGQISLGHGAFYAVGAYLTAIMIGQWGAPYWWTPPAAALACLGAGFLFGLPALRLKGHYLALATFALALSVPPLLKAKQLEHWTGGVQGIYLPKPDAPLGLPLTADQWLYLYCLVYTVLLFVLGSNLLRGRVGRALIAIRDHPTAAEAMGVNTAFMKSLAFGVSAAYAGVAGSLSAVVLQFVAPDSFHFFLSITFLIGIVVGGLASVSGAVFGAIFIQFVPNMADQISKSAPWAIYGIVTMVFLYALPTGVAGGMRRAWDAVAARTAKKRSAGNLVHAAGSAATRTPAVRPPTATP